MMLGALYLLGVCLVVALLVWGGTGAAVVAMGLMAVLGIGGTAYFDAADERARRR